MPSAPPTRAPASWRPSPRARVGSWLGDWAVVGGWLGVLTLAGLVLRPTLGVSATVTVTPGSLLASDVAVTLATVVPYVCYLALTESSARQATLGKRWAGLVVTALDGTAPSRSAVWLRNVVKALPWQLAHLGASRGILEVQEGWGLGLVVLSLVLAVLCAAPALVGGRGIHDRAAGTRVARVASRGMAP
ncbi:RDD family protein [Serinicoccus chungangensis]|uniref:RDD family protein n=1 Tax=Serinicoccus chungangensis TaxID=767452 RepID=UPI001117FEE8|nr:RDD family protein [Serinicoccus chungangensis]